MGVQSLKASRHLSVNTEKNSISSGYVLGLPVTRQQKTAKPVVFQTIKLARHQSISAKIIKRAFKKVYCAEPTASPCTKSGAAFDENTNDTALRSRKSFTCSAKAMDAGEDEASQDDEESYTGGIGVDILEVYKAPCEKQLDCIPEIKNKYLINERRALIRTNISSIQFGIRMTDWKKVIFKTVLERENAEREAQMFDKIKKKKIPHTLTLLDSFQNLSNNTVFVFERMDSLNIYNRDLKDIAKIITSVIISLVGIHKAQLVHLDINPSNIMVSRNAPYLVKVIDFGLACEANSAGVLPKRGTCGFIAPEVLKEEYGDGRADMYSLGVVFGMMLTDYFPGVDLRYLGSSNVRYETTSSIVDQLSQLLAGLEYKYCDIFEDTTSHISDSDINSQGYRYSSDQRSRGFEPVALKNSPNLNYSQYLSQSNPGMCEYYLNEEYNEEQGHNHNSYDRWLNRNIVYKPKIERPRKSSEIHRIPMAIQHAADLLRLLLEEFPENRPTAKQALKHPFFEFIKEIEKSDSANKSGSQKAHNRANDIKKLCERGFSDYELFENNEYFNGTTMVECSLWTDQIESLMKDISEDETLENNIYY
ncbi:Death-associated protein kinase dapk-1 [Zancudomyces culisetae]|uniref:Death-associated protein kinase dapk-1 n=1 Tax=Zancudomyces culisetae TaxID=1213189 RepID=A0A1R1PTD9_ZANCU|nr:Death-associated protein kinase dapk-1 [Zancudomyces culisetae]|eukprot:OMH84256.1 Death-associated protein kinase dapk-1 [Zancudomyces culisetae]